MAAPVALPSLSKLYPDELLQVGDSSIAQLLMNLPAAPQYAQMATPLAIEALYKTMKEVDEALVTYMELRKRGRIYVYPSALAAIMEAYLVAETLEMISFDEDELPKQPSILVLVGCWLLGVFVFYSMPTLLIVFLAQNYVVELSEWWFRLP